MSSPDRGPDQEPGEYRVQLEGEVFGKGKDTPNKFDAQILLSPSAVGLDKDASKRAEYYENRKTWPNYLIVLRNGEQDLGVVLYMMQGGCRGMIIEAGGLQSHTAILSREMIEDAMERENRHDKVLIGAVENASSVLKDGQAIEVDLSDPYHVKIQVKEESPSR